MRLRNLFLWVFLITSTLTFAQQTITGSVKDSAGKPVAGATVLVVGTSRNATTNTEGMYAIEAQGEETLQFAAHGYQNVERKVGLETTIDVVLALLTEDAKKVGPLGLNVMPMPQVIPTLHWKEEKTSKEKPQDLPLLPQEVCKAPKWNSVVRVVLQEVANRSSLLMGYLWWI